MQSSWGARQREKIKIFKSNRKISHFQNHSESCFGVKISHSLNDFSKYSVSFLNSTKNLDENYKNRCENFTLLKPVLFLTKTRQLFVSFSEKLKKSV